MNLTVTDYTQDISNVGAGFLYAAALVVAGLIWVAFFVSCKLTHGLRFFTKIVSRILGSPLDIEEAIPLNNSTNAPNQQVSNAGPSPQRTNNTPGSPTGPRGTSGGEGTRRVQGSGESRPLQGGKNGARTSPSHSNASELSIKYQGDSQPGLTPPRKEVERKSTATPPVAPAHEQDLEWTSFERQLQSDQLAGPSRLPVKNVEVTNPRFTAELKGKNRERRDTFHYI